MSHSLYAIYFDRSVDPARLDIFFSSVIMYAMRFLVLMIKADKIVYLIIFMLISPSIRLRIHASFPVSLNPWMIILVGRLSLKCEAYKTSVLLNSNCSSPKGFSLEKSITFCTINIIIYYNNDCKITFKDSSIFMYKIIQIIQ